MSGWLQVRKWHYEIPGYSWPDSESDPKYPTGPETQAYLQSYARDAGVVPHVRFGVEVHSLTPLTAAGAGTLPGSGGWEVEWSEVSASKARYASWHSCLDHASHYLLDTVPAQYCRPV